jgi:hypothetical protein
MNVARRAALDRTTGSVLLFVASADTQAAHAVSLCKFLIAHGIPCSVEEGPSEALTVQLRGVQDLDTVERRIAEWEQDVSSNPPEAPSMW